MRWRLLRTPIIPAKRALGGGLLGAGTGAVIGAIAGGGHGAGVGALVGGALVGGALVGGDLVGGDLVGGDLVGGDLVGGDLVGGDLGAVAGAATTPARPPSPLFTATSFIGPIELDKVPASRGRPAP